MINSGEVKTSIDFVNKFMFALDSEEPFPININMLVEEKIYDKKENAITKLKNSFSEGTDYQVQSLIPECSGIKKSGRGGDRKSKTITLTVDCFKAMCMIAQSAFGKQTQMYYLDLEKIFKKYITVEYEKEKRQLELNFIYSERKLLESEDSLKEKSKEFKPILQCKDV